MECVGYKEDSLVFYCRKEKKYYIRRSDNYFQFNVIVPNLGKFEYVELEEILNDKIIWKAYCERDDSVKFICLNGENVLFEYTSNISHEENSYKAGFFNGGRSVYIKKFRNYPLWTCKKLRVRQSTLLYFFLYKFKIHC